MTSTVPRTARSAQDGKYRASAALVIALTTWTAAGATSAAAAERISYVTAGGVYLENIKKAFLEPIGKRLDIEWSIETSDNDTQVRVQARAGSSTFDIVEFGSTQCARGARDGLYEKLDLKQIDVKDFIPGSYSDYFLGSTVYSTVLAFNTAKIAKPPTNWAEFWDVRNFPGVRSLRKTARHVLEAALMADGVAPDKLYPLDLDRAIASLRKIKPHIKTWWGSGAESQTLMKDGGIELMNAFNARVDSVKSDGAPMSYTFNQGTMEFGCWAIVKGTKKKDLAMKILAEFAKPEYQAEMARLSNYGAANTKIVETGRITAAEAAKLPTGPDNVKRQVMLDADWWAENGAKAIERFDQLLAE